MALYIRTLRADERAKLEEILRLQPYDELGRRARIVLLSADHVGVQEISAVADLHPINVRKWIHRFNRYGLNGLYPRRSPGRPSCSPRISVMLSWAWHPRTPRNLA